MELEASAGGGKGEKSNSYVVAGIWRGGDERSNL